MSATTLPEAPQRAALPRDLSEFLIELSIGVHRYAMYPPGHPSLVPLVENVTGRLGELFQDRRTLSIGVAAKQLVIEGMATDERHPVLSDLARRLHDHQLGAVSFSKGVTADMVAELLEVLASESERGATPLGLREPDDFPEWEHARIYRVGYEQLELSGAESDEPSTMDRASALWLGLAQSALSADTPMDQMNDPTVIARSIDERERDAAYDQVIVGYMLQLADELKGAEGRESEKVKARVSRLMSELDDSTLGRLVEFGGSFDQRKQFMLDANQSLAVDSVVKLVQAAATSSEQTISSSMTRLLSKLAVHASEGGGPVRSQADTALRENVEALVADWELKDPNPEAYTAVLDQMSRAAPVFQADDDEEEQLSGPERIVQMALEVEAFGPTVQKAMADLMARGDTGILLEMTGDVDEANQVAQRIRRHLTSPSEFRRLLAGGNVDPKALDSLLDEMGSSAVDPLLDVLAESDSRSVRRRVFDALAKLGPFVAQRAIERMEDGRWFVLRNMLALLERLGHVPEGFDARRYLNHSDPRVRREAFPLALRLPGLRDRALVAALADDDERMVRMALLAIQEELPDAVVPSLVNRVVLAEKRSGEIRAMGARALGSTAAPLALRTLVELSTGGGKGLFGKAKLAAKSRLLVEAIRALARGWASSPEVGPILELAAGSRDPDIRAAAQLAASQPEGAS